MREAAAKDTARQEEPVEIVYYTDPLCCWSWAFEPQWQRLKNEFAGKIRWRYCMVGMIPDWSRYSDPVNSVHRPFQLGPLWLEVSRLSGRPLYDRLWLDDPPASSYPGCIAVKCAAFQSAIAEDRYLSALRETIMVNGRNPARQDVLLEVAAQVAAEMPAGFDIVQFREDLAHKRGEASFMEDLRRVRFYNIGRFPTLTMNRNKQAGVMITGYRPYEVLVEGLKQAAPELDFPGSE